LKKRRIQLQREVAELRVELGYPQESDVQEAQEEMDVESEVP
jgi:hypothetical protein